MNVGSGSESPNDDGAVAAFVEAAFGDFYWCREPGGDQIPNGVVSRWPILACGQWTDPEVSSREVG